MGDRLQIEVDLENEVVARHGLLESLHPVALLVSVVLHHAQPGIAAQLPLESLLQAGLPLVVDSNGA